MRYKNYIIALDRLAAKWDLNEKTNSFLSSSHRFYTNEKKIWRVDNCDGVITAIYNVNQLLFLQYSSHYVPLVISAKAT